MSCTICGGETFPLQGETAGGNYKKCRECGVETLIVDDAAAKFAAAQADYFHDDPLSRSTVIMEARREAAEKRFAKLRSSLRSGRLLEIGPGGGQFLALARKAGFDAEGVDESPGMAEQAQSLSGAKVYVGELEKVEFGDAYDNVVSIHVIEHVPDPVAHMKSAANFVKPGAICAIITPNVDGWEHRLMRNRSASYSTAHLNLFSAKALQKVLEDSGWEVMQATTIEQPPEWIRAIRRILRRNPLGRNEGGGGSARAMWLFKAFGIISAPVRRLQGMLGGGSELLVVARIRRR